VLATAACGGSVEIDSPDVDARTRAACAQFLDALPETVAGQRQRETEPRDALGAAYGDPPIVITCGVDMPEGFDAFSTCQEVDGVGWYIPEDAADDQSADVEMTTIGFSPIVRIDLPADYRPPADALVEVGAAVRGTLERTDRCV
jgi:hypothetical protein